MLLSLVLASLLTAEPASTSSGADGVGARPPPMPVVKKTLIISGAAAFGTAYLLAVGFGVATEVLYAPRPGLGGVNPLRSLFIPIVGPVLAAARPDALDTAGKVVFVVDAVVQLAGAALLVTGLVLQPKEAPVQAWVSPWFQPGLAGATFGLKF